MRSEKSPVEPVTKVPAGLLPCDNKPGGAYGLAGAEACCPGTKPLSSPSAPGNCAGLARVNISSRSAESARS